MRHLWLLGLGLFPGIACAGAWPQPQGAFQLITQVYAYTSEERFDGRGRQVIDDEFTKHEINPYLEYGVTPWLTVGASAFVQSLSQDRASTGNTEDNFGIADTELFARTRLWQSKSGRRLTSTQLALRLPRLFSTSDDPTLGSAHSALALSQWYGEKFSLFGREHFFELEVGGRLRFGDPENQAFSSAAIGFNVSDRWLILSQAFTTKSLATRLANASFTNSPSDDYDLLKYQISAVYHWREDLGLQVGYFAHLDGINVGRGRGFMVALWQKF